MADTDTTDDAASTVRSRRTSSKASSRSDDAATESDQPSQTTATGPDSSLTGVSSGSARGARTLSGSFVAGTTEPDEYVSAAADGYVATYPRGAQQTTTTLAWVKGQRVRKDYYEAHGGDSAATRPQDAKPDNEPGGGYGV